MPCEGELTATANKNNVTITGHENKSNRVKKSSLEVQDESYFYYFFLTEVSHMASITSEAPRSAIMHLGDLTHGREKLIILRAVTV